MQSLIGTGVAVVTPFTVNKEVDYPALRKIIHHLIEGQVEYLVAMGTTAEAPTLKHEEKLRVLDTFFEETEGKLPLVMGIGGNNTQNIVKHVEDYNNRYPEIEAILSVSPYYNKPSQEGIYQHYKAISEASDTPIILYNVPGRTSSNISAETSLRLAHDCENVVAIKDASGSVEQWMEIVQAKPDGFLLLSGDDSLVLPLISIGGSGIISVSANAFPRAFSDMVRYALASDFKAAQELHYQLFDMMKLHFAEGNPAGVKTAMALQGLCESEVRLPLVKGTNALKQKMAKFIPVSH